MLNVSDALESVGRCDCFHSFEDHFESCGIEILMAAMTITPLKKLEMENILFDNNRKGMKNILIFTLIDEQIFEDT